MSRQKCCRKVGSVPDTTCYRPEDDSGRMREAVVLNLDEFEAIRLADFDGLYQEEAARSMSVSRQTFGRIIGSAHGKIADVLMNGKALRIEGGNVSIASTLRTGCDRCKKSVVCRQKSKDRNCPRFIKAAL